MTAYSDGSERFVETPGIVDICVISDDPDFFAAPEDLFDKQGQGLPAWIGVKNKMTREQVFFNCKVCDCELKSVVTLRAHCRGTQHGRKALQKKKEYREAQKLNRKRDGAHLEAAGTNGVTITSREPKQEASRKCHAYEQGSLEEWKRRGDWQYFARCEREKLKETESRKDEEYSWRVERVHRDSSNLRSPPGPLPSIHDRRELKWENVSGFKDRYESRRVVEYKMPSSRMGQEILGSSRGNASKLSNESDSGWGSEGEAQHGIEELRRRGDFANWKTAVVKKEEIKKEEGGQRAKTLPPAPEKDEEEEIERLHRKVRDTVCCHLNHYWPDAEDFLGDSKFASRAHYSSLAKDCSHRLRELIKESYFTLHGTLKGILLTPDNKAFIKADIEMLMERLPTLN